MYGDAQRAGKEMTMAKKLGTSIVVMLLCAVFLFSACDPAVTTEAQPSSAEPVQSTAAESEPKESSEAQAVETPSLSPSASQSAESTMGEPKVGPEQAGGSAEQETTAEGQVTPNAAQTPSAETTPSSTPAPSVAPSSAPVQTPEPEEQQKVRTQTPCGPVEGVQADGISVYKGIPYAAPPVDDLRFAPPQDVTPWTEVLDCTEFGPIAVQDKAQEGSSMSEDCLSLNIWTPAKSGHEKLPVYVWIHGGGFAQGSGAQDLYDGTNFAKDGIVVVTINYRLNALGFLATQETYDEYGTTGNWGLLDQIKALEWVRDNIEAFGGNPDQVTIGGESAGSYSVSALVVSPLAEGLFQNAIMESGSILGLPGNSYYGRGDLQRSIEVSNMLSYTFGAADNAAGLERLRAADPDILAQMAPMGMDFTFTQAFLMTPVYDGYVMPTDVYGALQNGQINDVNLLWGYNGNEGSIFVPEDTTEERYEMLVSRMYGYGNMKNVVNRFPVDAQNTSGQRARDTLAYGMFSAVMKPFGDAVAEKGNQVYAYQFNYVTEENEKNGLGAHHGSEIAYAFDNLDNPDAGQQKLAEEMHARWVNFIKTGDPNEGDVPSGVQWPAYDQAGSQMLIFDTTVTAGEMTGKEDIEFMEDVMFGSGAGYR